MNKRMTELELKVLEAAKMWLTDRAPIDIIEKNLALAVAKAWPEELECRETCKCDDSANCDECPTEAEMKAVLSRWEKDIADQQL